MSNDTIIVSLLTIFIVKNSRYIVRLSGKLSGMDDNSLNTLFHTPEKKINQGAGKLRCQSGLVLERHFLFRRFVQLDATFRFFQR